MRFSRVIWWLFASRSVNSQYSNSQLPIPKIKYWELEVGRWELQQPAQSKRFGHRAGQIDTQHNKTRGVHGQRGSGSATTLFPSASGECLVTSRAHAFCAFRARHRRRQFGQRAQEGIFCGTGIMGAPL